MKPTDRGAHQMGRKDINVHFSFHNTSPVGFVQAVTRIQHGKTPAQQFLCCFPQAAMAAGTGCSGTLWQGDTVTLSPRVPTAARAPAHTAPKPRQSNHHFPAKAAFAAFLYDCNCY